MVDNDKPVFQGGEDKLLYLRAADIFRQNTVVPAQYGLLCVLHSSLKGQGYSF